MKTQQAQNVQSTQKIKKKMQELAHKFQYCIHARKNIQSENKHMLKNENSATTVVKQVPGTRHVIHSTCVTRIQRAKTCPTIIQPSHDFKEAA